MTARQFRLSLDRFKGLVREQFVAAQRVVTISLLGELQMGNPVRTGRSRASWIASAGEPSLWQPGNLGGDSPGELARTQALYGVVAKDNEVRAQLLRIEFGDPTHVVTNVDYVPHVNDHHPRRAGFFEAAVENVVTRYQIGAAIEAAL